MTLRFDQEPHVKEIRESYLATLQSSLGSGRSAGEIYDSIEEMREHLNAMADAEIELGLEPVLAMRNAIQKFGRPEKVAPPINRYENLSLNLRGIAKTWLGGMALLEVVGAGLMVFYSSGLRGLPLSHPFYYLLSMSLDCAPDMLMLAIAAHTLRLKPLPFAAFVTSVYTLWSALNLYSHLGATGMLMRTPEYLLFAQSMVAFCLSFMAKLTAIRASTKGQRHKSA